MQRGEILLLTEGEYSSYQIIGLYKILKDYGKGIIWK